MENAYDAIFSIVVGGSIELIFQGIKYYGTAFFSLLLFSFPMQSKYQSSLQVFLSVKDFFLVKQFQGIEFFFM